jgi:hypothetical protein
VRKVAAQVATRVREIFSIDYLFGGGEENRETPDLYITCISDGLDAPAVAWGKSNRPIFADTSRLVSLLGIPDLLKTAYVGI